MDDEQYSETILWRVQHQLDTFLALKVPLTGEYETRIFPAL